MPPVTQNGLKSQVEQLVAENKVMVFSKTTCPFCKKVKELFKSVNIPYHAVELDKEGNGADVQNTLLEITGQKTVPNVFIGGKHIGGCDDVMKTHKEGRLLSLVNAGSGTEDSYDYDLIVIGGGSGGLAASKEAAGFGVKVAVLDFVKPSPQGSSWGLGGTCVNVGCIPKKLMHQAAILGHDLEDSKHYGWEYADGVKHNWDKLRNGVQDHIGSLNWGYRVSLRDKKVDYHNAYAEFIGPHKIKATNRRGKMTEMTGRYFILAMGGRPRYPDIPGAKEYAITSDDIFSLPYSPGKTLCIGASYISLENAGFLAGLGYDVTVMVRSILLRGFDQQMAEIIGKYMADHKVKFIRETVPTKIERLEEGSPGKLRVTATTSSGEVVEEEYNTVMVAVGRDACTRGLGLEEIGVELNPKNGKVMTNDLEQTKVAHIYAIGDILDGRQELTPVAIQAGRLLARRLFNGETTLCDYVNVPTTVFTPLEYGCIGLSEEDAISQYGEDNIEVYHTNFLPLEWTVPHREENACYSKLVCLKSEDERVIGFHVAGPHAGEITQGYAVAMKLGAKKADFDRTVGIHPTMSENFTTLTITKSSGVDAAASGC